MKKNNGYFHSVKAEFAERVFSSRKRVIKFIAICFVPFLYAFICIWAFWNPIPKIGEAPIALVSNDAKINFIVGRSGNKVAVGEAYAYKETDDSAPIIIDSDFDISSLPNGYQIITKAGTIIKKDENMVYNKTSLVDNLVESWKAGSVENIRYNIDKDKFTFVVNESMSLTNVSFLNGDAARDIAVQKSDGEWDVKNENKYWAQVQIPTNLTSDIIGWMDANLQKLGLDKSSDPAAPTRGPTYFLNDLKENSMQFWSTYKHNFLFGQFMYIFNEFKSSLIIDMGPQVISDVISMLIQNVINHNKSELVFKAPENSNDSLTVTDHGSTSPHQVTINFVKGQEYVLRDQEIIDQIKIAHPTWNLPILSIEGTTGTDPCLDWGTDGFLSILAKNWNDLMNSGDFADLLALGLGASLSKKINAQLPEGYGSLIIDSDGIKKLFSTAGNIAGLFEQNGLIIPSTTANFPIFGSGPIAGMITDYKSLITVSSDILTSKFNLVSILAADSSNESVYALPFGSLINPKPGTFVYNFQHDIRVITGLILGIKTNESSSFNDLGGLLPDFSGFLKTKISGSQFNQYGIGLGQFFLCIGLWVGTLMQTFVFDRAKRVKDAKPWAWYLSKTTLMLATAWIQTTILMLSVYALGWSAIGSAFGLVYLWMLFTVTVFVLIQQALWFSVQDETVGKFLIIILLIINLSSGWGTFPTFMQATIFDILSYVAPYTYSMHGQGVIIYSIAVTGASAANTGYIFQQFGILLAWAVAFVGLGLFSSYRRNRDMFYGTHKSKKLAEILKEEDLGKYVNRKNQRVIWKKLPKEEMPDIRKKVKKRYPEEGQYQWYKKWKAKNQQKPLTASESDDEIIARND